MNHNLPGPGDEATWPAYSGHPNDPRGPLDDGEDEEDIDEDIDYDEEEEY
jgi:hypothetical protein